jgi:4'-phosphopantetheinyl transferase EntD
LAVHLETVICTRGELAWLDTQPPPRRGLWAKQIFSAKEAFYKAQYPVTGSRLGFQDAYTRLIHEQSIFDVVSHAPTRVKIREVDGLILTTCTIPSTDGS